jgi:hypothetical protein
VVSGCVFVENSNAVRLFVTVDEEGSRALHTTNLGIGWTPLKVDWPARPLCAGFSPSIEMEPASLLLGQLTVDGPSALRRFSLQ